VHASDKTGGQKTASDSKSITESSFQHAETPDCTGVWLTGLPE